MIFHNDKIFLFLGAIIAWQEMTQVQIYPNLPDFRYWQIPSYEMKRWEKKGELGEYNAAHLISREIN